MIAAATVTIGVFGLFHPRAVEIEPWGSSRVEVHCARRILEGRSRERLSSNCEATGPGGAPTDFILSIPGRIRRRYQGTLKVTPQPSGEVIATVTMALETAVATIVAAESPAGASPAMLEAQAMAVRSYLSAGPKHKEFAFCDTTHCQFLKDPPMSSARKAARQTEGRILTYRQRPIPAFYAARCNGQLAPLPRPGTDEYPYFAVKCEYCQHTPAAAPPRANARPHHHGMCQLGANAMAKQGATAAQILAHYYPGAELR